MTEVHISLEEEARKEFWVKKLSQFIVIANGKTWASDGGEVEPRRPGYKRHQWPYPSEKMSEDDKKDYEGWEDWRLEDEYVGYFRAPGMTTIYYKDKPAWTMSYGGHGQTEGQENKVKGTFEFLRKALQGVTADMPFRGPKHFFDVVGDKIYHFELLKGDISDFEWEESIVEGEDGVMTFSQVGFGGIVVGKDSSRMPVYPWNL